MVGTFQSAHLIFTNAIVLIFIISILQIRDLRVNLPQIPQTVHIQVIWLQSLVLTTTLHCSILTKV
jgi:hypothetical protein